MKRSVRRNFARLLVLESLETRRLLTTAMPDSFSLLEDSPAALLDVMANDIVTGNVATIVRVSSVDYGSLEIRNGDKIAFTPAANAFGETMFTYTIRDQFGTESTGTAAITISAVNDAPTINQIADIRTTYNEIGREVLLRNATAGPGETTQNFTIQATSNRPELIRDLVVEKQAESGLAKLRFQTAGGAEGTAIITVQVHDSEGLTVQRIFNVDVIGIHSETPFQNSSNILDVNGDAFIGPIDVLILMNRFAANNDASIPTSGTTLIPPPFLDVNGDNYIDPLDAVSIIDALNHFGGGDSGQVVAGPRAAKGERLFEFQYRILDAVGNDLDPNPNDGIVEGLVGPGMTFYVQLLARDLRGVPAGLFASYSDLVYTNSDGSASARIEPFSVANDGSVAGSVERVLGGLKQGMLVDNRSSVAGQRILVGVGEMSSQTINSWMSDFYPVMKTRFIAKEKGIVELSQQLSKFAMGVPGFVAFNSTGDFLGPAEVLLPTAKIHISDAFEAFDDEALGLEDEVLVIDVLANDVDVSRTSSIITPLVPPVIGGELRLVNGKLEYRPPANFYGTTSFSYTIKTSDGREDSAMVRLTFEPVNDHPTISDLSSLSIPEGLAFTTNSFSVSAGPFEDQSIRVMAISSNSTIVSNPILEKVTGGDYRMTFMPPLGASGTANVFVTVEDGGLDSLIETSDDNLTTVRSFAVTVTQSQRDFGDAPSNSQSGMLLSYPTQLNQDGPFHIGTSLRLGDLRDSESDGQPHQTANGDDNNSADDEDGILFPFTHPISDKVATISSFVANVSQASFLDVWIDFNRDGDWNDAGENISKKVPVRAGRNIIPFEIPTLPLTGTVDVTFGRFRLSRTGDLVATGFGGEGEVEDHSMIMNRSFSQELEAYDHILGPHEINVVNGFLTITSGETVVFRAPAENISVFRRKNMSGETTFEMRNPGSNLPGQLSYSQDTGRIELKLARTVFDLGANTEFLAGLNAIRLGQTQAPTVLGLELEDIQNLNNEKTLRIEMTKEDSLETESPWKPSTGRMENGSWVQVFIVTSSSTSNEPLATLEIVSEAVWRNETRVTDADGDATTSPLDVLTLVNFINAKTFGEEGLLPPRTDSSLTKFPDVDGDQFLSALDVLNVINFLNTRGNGTGGNAEGEGESIIPTTKSSFTISPHDIDHYMYSYADDFDQDTRTTRRRRSL